MIREWPLPNNAYAIRYIPLPLYKTEAQAVGDETIITVTNAATSVTLNI